MRAENENDRRMFGKTENDRPMFGEPFGLEEGTCYLVRGKKAETSYLLFQDIVPRESAFAVQSRLLSGLVDFLRPRRSTLRPKRHRHPGEDDRGLRRPEPSRIRRAPGRC